MDIDRRDDHSSLTMSGQPGDLDPLAVERTIARLQRILQYQDHALDETDLLKSNLRIVNSGLMNLELHLEQAILAALGDGAANIAELAPLMPAIQTLMRLTQQMRHFAVLDGRIEVRRQRRAEEAKPLAPEFVLPAQSEEIAT